MEGPIVNALDIYVVMRSGTAGSLVGGLSPVGSQELALRALSVLNFQNRMG